MLYNNRKLVLFIVLTVILVPNLAFAASSTFPPPTPVRNELKTIIIPHINLKTDKYSYTSPESIQITGEVVIPPTSAGPIYVPTDRTVLLKFISSNFILYWEATLSSDNKFSVNVPGSRILYPGVYTITAEYRNIHGSTVALVNYDIPSISLWTDRQSYVIGDVILLRGQISGVSNPTSGTVSVYGPSSGGNVGPLYFSTPVNLFTGIFATRISTTNAGNFPGTYTIKVTYGLTTSQTTFELRWPSNRLGPIVYGCSWDPKSPLPNCYQSQEFPRYNISPENQIRIPNGVVTVLFHTGENGVPLNISYESPNILPITDYPPACSGPAKGLYQVKTYWYPNPPADHVAGAKAVYRTPPVYAFTGSYQFWFNPINFRYGDAEVGHGVQDYIFYQVSYAIGQRYSGWYLIAMYKDDQGREHYNADKIRGIEDIRDATYIVAASLQPNPYSTVAYYVVEIAHGNTATITAVPIGYFPDSQHMHTFHTLVDEYTQWIPLTISNSFSDAYHNMQYLTKTQTGISDGGSWVTAVSSVTEPRPDVNHITRNVLQPVILGGSTIVDVPLCYSVTN